MHINPEKEYRVKGRYINRTANNSKQMDRKIKGADLDQEHIRLITKRRAKIAKIGIAGTVVIGLAAWNVVNLIGTTGENISQEDGVAALQNTAAKKYNSKSLREKFEMTYVGTFTVKARSIRGGSGALGKRNPYAATFGQKCLSPTPFNTKPSEITGRSEGVIMPPASFHIDGQTGDALVTPYGGDNDNSLRFSVQNGELIPTVATIATLAANKCVIADGIPTSTPLTKNGFENTDVIDVSNLIPPLHPGHYQS